MLNFLKKKLWVIGMKASNYYAAARVIRDFKKFGSDIFRKMYNSVVAYDRGCLQYCA